MRGLGDKGEVATDGNGRRAIYGPVGERLEIWIE